MLTINEIKKITNAIQINGDSNVSISKFSVRRNRHYEGDFYIPIFWREDRQVYIMDAVKAGAIGYIISKNYENKDKIISESIKINSNIIILEVDDINEAIFKMAEFKRNQRIDMPIIAVTGSVGKTTTTAMISSIIKEEKNVFYDNGNNNSKPLIAWLMLDFEDYEMAVFEAGMGSKNCMQPISDLLKPSIVVINNIGTSHIGNLGSKEEILEEKLKLTTYMKDSKTVFLNNDDEMLKNVKLDSSYNVKRFSLSEAYNIKQNGENLTFDTLLYDKNVKFSLEAYGKHNVSNALCAIRVAEFLKLKTENIVNGLKNYASINKRFNVVKKDNYTIIDDTYNASLDSMQAGLMNASLLEGKRKVAVLGDMLELGEYSKSLHEQVGEIFKDTNFDMLLTNGENSKYICEVAKKYMTNKIVENFENQADLIAFLLNKVKEGDLIYLKASRKMNFDNIVKSLKENNI